MTKYKLIITNKYEKLQYKWLSKQSSQIREKYYTTLEMLTIDPFYSSLRLHKLNGILSDNYSVSIDMKRRILIDFIIEDQLIIPIDIGDHDIYRKK